MPRPTALDRRLWFVVPGDIESRTGGYVYDKRLIEELRALGWSVTHVAWASSFPFPTEDDVRAAAASLAALPDNALAMIDGLAFGVLDDVARAEARRLRLVAMIHHPLALESGLAAGFSNKLRHSEQRALAAARAAIVTSDTTAATLVKEFGVPAGNVTVAKPGVDRPSDDRAMRPIDGPIRLLSVGTVTPRKGHQVLVRALGQLADLSWTCGIVGSLDRAPKTVAEVRALIDRHRLGGRIALVGEVRDPAPFYREADIFVLPSRYEGYGMVFAEAIAHGLPIVSTDAGAIPEVVPRAARILVPVDDADALAVALRRLITEPALRLRLADGALRAADALPRWTDTAAKVASALDRIDA